MRPTKRKTIAIVLLCTLGVVGAIGGYNLIRTFFEKMVWSGGRLFVPPSLEVTPSYLSWGDLRLDEEQVVSEQPVTVRNLGMVPLRLQAFPVAETESPDWFKEDECWLFGWSADGYVLGRGETIETTFKLLVLAEKTARGVLQRNSTESNFYFDVKIEAGDWREGESFVHYCSEADYAAAALIAENKSLSMVKGVHVVMDLKDPETYDPFYDNNNMICLGCMLANPYVAYHFPGYYVDWGTLTFKGGEGISEDGKRFITTKTRPSGYNITAICGVGAEDTYDAAVEFAGYRPMPKPAYTLTIEQCFNGSTNPKPGNHTYTEGMTATIMAIPDLGYEVDHWVLNGSDAGKSSSLSVTMDNNYTLACLFKEEEVAEGAIIHIEPSTQAVSVGEEFSVLVYIENVTGLFSFQVAFAYPHEGFNYSSHSYPSGWIFGSASMHVPVFALAKHSVLIGASLLSIAETFDGDSSLCEITFIALKPGTYDISFDNENTILVNSQVKKMPFSTETAQVTIS